MKTIFAPAFAAFFFALGAHAQLTVPLPDRQVVKLLPDYGRPTVYALNTGNGAVPGTLLALNSSNGAVRAEISLGLKPSDMAMSPAGEALYVINAGARTIMKVNLESFAVTATRPFTTPNTYNPDLPLYIAAAPSDLLYFTDGGWSPGVYTFDFPGGTNVSLWDDDNGVGGLAVTRDGATLYTWRQYGWGAGNVNSWVTRFAINSGVLNPQETSFVSWRRDPADTPVLLNGPETAVFNKQQMFAATNVSVLLQSFAENIYAISLDGRVALGSTTLFNTQNGLELTNFSFASSVQSLSGDQRRLFRYRANVSEMYIYDMTQLASLGGPLPEPVPADGAVVALRPTQLAWSPSPVALAYRVYFGASQSEAANATTNSSQYLGQVADTSIPLNRSMTPGSTYYWRLDRVGFSEVTTGPVWSFTVAPIAVVPQRLDVGAIAAYNPAPSILSLTSSVTRSWTATIRGANWLSLSATSGTTPANISVSFTTTNLAVGIYSNIIDITSGGITVPIPVALDVRPLNVTKMVTDYQRPYIYALQPAPFAGQSGRLLFINTASEQIEKALPIVGDSRDLSINYAEGRLYIVDGGVSGSLWRVDLNTQTVLPNLLVDPNHDRVNAGRAGRVVMEEWNQWVMAKLYDTTTNPATVLSSTMLREGDGEMSPDGRFYYHCDNNSSAAGVSKWALTNDTFTLIGGGNGHPYGSRHLLLSADGTRLFWRGFMYDTELSGPDTNIMAELANLNAEIYATTIHGELAFSSRSVFNTRNGQVLYSLPAQSTVIAVSGDQQKVFYYDAQQQRLRTVPMSDIAPLPTPGITPTPPDHSVVGLPLAQLNWTVSPFALEYRLFFGTNQAAVAAATTNSPLFAGAVTTTSIPVPTALQHNRTYFWRVDSVGFNNSVTGAVWRFTTAPVTVTPQILAIKGVAGLPILPETINISAPSSTAWAVTTDQPWLSASPGSGVTPASITLAFDTSAFASGTYTNALNFTAGGLTLRVPVSVELFNLEATLMLADRDRPCIYVLHRGSGSYDDAFLLFLNTDSGVVEKVLPIGRNPTDMSINRGENRLYVVNSGTSFLQVVDLNTRSLLSPLPVYTSIDRVNAGRPGRVVVEEWNQWVNAYLLDTTNNAAILTTAFLREGDGEFDPTGRYYYHSDNNISGAGMTKYDLNNSTFVSVGGVGGHYYYGSRHIVMSLDGSRLFWTGAAYDANLVDLGNIGVEIYACTTNGAIAFSSDRAYDTATRQAIFNLPATTTVMAVDRRDQRLWYFHPVSKQIESLSVGVIRAPTITQQPTGATVPVGAPVYMTVTATGYAPLAYQWLFAGTTLPGETNFFLSLTSAQPAQSGNYQVVVSNPYGSVTSAVAQVIVQVAPAITQQPSGISVAEGGTALLTVQASGTAPLRYQWSFEGVNIAGATNATLTLPSVQSSHAGAYRVQVSNAAGSVTSSSAILRVTPAPPMILSGPTNVTVAAGNLAAFAVTVAGSAPFTYQWRFNGAPLTAPSSPALVISNAQASHAGDYFVVVANGLGAATSAVARLTVTPSAPVFTLQPQGTNFPVGTNNLVLASLARGTEPISYQWRRNGTNLPGATLPSLVLSNVSPAHSGAYTVLASNTVGVTTSAVANVIITGVAPVFVQQPESQSLLAGNTLALFSRASGSDPLSYQWRRNGTNLPGATSRILTISNASPTHSGAYSVLASNAFGAATSITANVMVIVPPSFALTLTNMAVDAGTNVDLFVVAQSSAPVNFSWQFNGIALPVSSGSNLFLTNVQAAHSGTYRVTAANQYGSVSARMHLTVFPPVGTVFAWGDDIAGQSTVPPGLANVVRVAGGDFHTLALRRDGSVAAWGYNGDGQVSTPALGNIVAIAAGASHNLALGLDGRVVAWGNNDYGQTQVPNAATSVVAVAAGEAHSMALRQDGTLVAWGDGSRGQTDLSQAGFVTSIAAGRNHTIALRNDRTVLGWGLNSHGQRTAPQGLNNVTAIAAGYLHSLALRADGTVVAWGDNSYGQTAVPLGLSNVVAIAAGELHSLALRSDGVVIAWGDNIFEQSNVPPSLGSATGVASGYYHSLAIVPVPALGFANRANGLVLWWNGNCMLQQASSATGPFTDVTASSPCTNLWSQQTSARFFRLRPLY